MARPAPDDFGEGGERRRRSTASTGRRRTTPRRQPSAADMLGLSDYVEAQPITAVIAAAMTGYAIAWYLRGGRSP